MIARLIICGLCLFGITLSSAAATQYTYDGLGRLTKIEYDTDRSSIVYDYDSSGNLKTSKATIPSASLVFSDDFNGSTLDPAKWASVGWTYRRDLPGPPPAIGATTISGGIADLRAFAGISTAGKAIFSGPKIVVEVRMARTGNGELPVSLHDTANVNDSITISDTSYCGAGLLAAGSGAYQFMETFPLCGGASTGHGINLGSPPAAGVWMEYRMTVDGDRLTIERGSTLANITQRATATLSQPISGRNFYLIMRTGDLNYGGAQYDWVKVYANSAIDFDLSRDYGSTNNPSGAWQYGWTNAVGAGFNLFTQSTAPSGFSNLKMWKGSHPYSLFVAKNDGATPLNYYGANIGSQEMYFHPGQIGERAIARFTAPETGSYSVIYSFALAEPGRGSVDVHLQRNGVQISADTLRGTGVSETGARNVTVDLLQGDQLDLVVGIGGDDYFSDSTIVRASITKR